MSFESGKEHTSRGQLTERSALYFLSSRISLPSEEEVVAAETEAAFAVACWSCRSTFASCSSARLRAACSVSA